MNNKYNVKFSNNPSLVLLRNLLGGELRLVRVAGYFSLFVYKRADQGRLLVQNAQIRLLNDVNEAAALEN